MEDSTSVGKAKRMKIEMEGFLWNRNGFGNKLRASEDLHLNHLGN